MSENSMHENGMATCQLAREHVRSPKKAVRRFAGDSAVSMLQLVNSTHNRLYLLF
jgi:hypothetical protein